MQKSPLSISKVFTGKKVFFLFTLSFLLHCRFVDAQNNPLAKPASIVKVNNARFTILTPGLIRMEWDTIGVFEDSATQVVINRNLGKVKYKVYRTSEKLVIETEKIRLEYLIQSQRFDSNNLIINGKSGNLKYNWNLSVADTGNLKGTTRTLDNYNGDVAESDFKTKLKLENGLLSTSGWFLMDDSKTYLLDNSDIPWVKERRSYSSQDLYFFSYGKDYKSALYDYTLIAGKVPLPPRYAFGYWWSRYYAYSDDELRTLVSKFEQNKVPLDVLVIDMDWHPTLGAYEKDPKRDLSGSRRGWTGYTWDRRLFPEPDKFLQWTASRELKVTLNLHPASGIPYTEEKYAEFAKILQFDTTGKSARKTEIDNPFAKWSVFDTVSYKDIPYEGTDKKYINTLFNFILHPLEKQGVDFWWLDWQQYKYSKIYKNLDNTWWLNHVFFLKMQQQDAGRPLIYHRWGGLGNHRYQIGFSGDAAITWKTLAYEPYFTATASNVLYGYWSHDIGGHLRSKDPNEDQDLAINPELYTRWIQFGAFSPILRTHSTQGLAMKREPWEFASKYSNVIENYISLRYSLAPYIYTMARETYDTGISLCRPLYYDYPDNNESYHHPTEYLFGDDILVAPIVEPSQNDISKVSIWLPKGSWIDLFSGTMLMGNQQIERHFALDEYPVFVKKGAIIPTYPTVKNLKHNCDTIILKIYGKSAAQSVLYEDGGDDDLYKKGFCATRKFITNCTGDYVQNLKLLPAKGVFKGMSKCKTYFVDLIGVNMPSSVKVNGKYIVKTVDNKTLSGWEYLANDIAVRIKLPLIKQSDDINVEVTYPSDNIDVNGLKGRMEKANNLLAYLRANIPISNIPEQFVTVGELGLNISYKPKEYTILIKQFLTIYENLETSIQSLNIEKKQKIKMLEILQP